MADDPSSDRSTSPSFTVAAALKHRTCRWALCPMPSRPRCRAWPWSR